MNGLTWSMTDLDRIARSAASNNWYGGADYSDLYHVAWSAVVDLYYFSDTAPTRHELATEARAGIWRHANTERRTYGYKDRDPWAGLGSAPRFASYWTVATAPVSPFEDRVLEPLALAEVWTRLTDRDRDVITAQAAFEDNRAAASALGMPTGSYSTYLSEARRRFAALWHDWETPHRLKGYTSRRNHNVPLKPCGTHAAYSRHKKNREPVDEACERAAYEYERNRKGRVAA